MMRLSTMWAVDRTIDAEGRSSIADQILGAWAHDAGTARFFRSSANFIYIFERAGGRHFLRFAADSERSRATIEAEVDLLNWLREDGHRVSAPVWSLAGNAVESVATPIGIVHAVAFRGLEGERVEIENLDEGGFRRWGAALGELHAGLRRYPTDERRASWEDHLAFIGSQIATDDVGPRAELHAIASELAALPRSVETFGLIHFDFELDNLIWRDGMVGMLDFDDAARYWYVADIAFALRDLFEEGVDLENASFRAFMEGYRGFCAIDDRMLAQTPLFLRLSELFSYARLTYALDLAEDEDYPDWLTGLNRRLHGWMERYRSSLAPAGG